MNSQWANQAFQQIKPLLTPDDLCMVEGDYSNGVVTLYSVKDSYSPSQDRVAIYQWRVDRVANIRSCVDELTNCLRQHYYNVASCE